MNKDRYLNTILLILFILSFSSVTIKSQVKKSEEIVTIEFTVLEEKPWESVGAGYLCSAITKDGKFKTFYQGTKGYAESLDVKIQVGHTYIIQIPKDSFIYNNKELTKIQLFPGQVKSIIVNGQEYKTN